MTSPKLTGMLAVIPQIAPTTTASASSDSRLPTTTAKVTAKATPIRTSAFRISSTSSSNSPSPEQPQPPTGRRRDRTGRRRHHLRQVLRPDQRRLEADLLASGNQQEIAAPDQLLRSRAA